MEELPIVWLAHREEICLTLEKGPGGTGAADSFIVWLSASQVVTSEQLRQTLVYKFVPATSIFQKKTNDPSKEGNNIFSRLLPKEHFGSAGVQEEFFTACFFLSI